MTTGMQSSIVIMGAAVQPDGTASPALIRRTRCAAQLWRQCGGVVIATGGNVSHTSTEASLMRDMLLQAGLPHDQILLEEKARNTLENARNVRDLLVSEGISDVTIVTDGYHRLRSWMSFTRLGVPVRTVSASRTAPRAAPLRVLRNWLREIIALPVYLLKLAYVRR